MTNYIRMCVFFFLQKYHLMQQSTFSVTVQYHFKISILQHCLLSHSSALLCSFIVQHISLTNVLAAECCRYRLPVLQNSKSTFLCQMVLL